MRNFLNPNKTAKRLKQVQTKLAYLQRQYARMKTIERKQDTRRKIQLGGLIKKAGLDGETTAVLFGLLLEAQEKLQTKKADKVRLEWRIKGDIGLTQTENKIKSLKSAKY